MITMRALIIKETAGVHIHTHPLQMSSQEEGGANLDVAPGGDDGGSSPSVTNQSACGVKKKRHRVPKEKDRDAQV